MDARLKRDAAVLLKAASGAARTIGTRLDVGLAFHVVLLSDLETTHRAARTIRTGLDVGLAFHVCAPLLFRNHPSCHEHDKNRL